MIKRIIWFAPAIGMMILIFFFSSQEAVASTETSTRLGRGIILAKSTVLGENLTEPEIEKQALYIDHAVRKTAHATEYAVLAILLRMGAVLSQVFGDASDEKRSKSLKNTGFLDKFKKLNDDLIYWIIAALYATSDEIHQYFVPGRSAQISDVIIDSIGAAIGICVFCAIMLCIKGRKSTHPMIKE